MGVRSFAIALLAAAEITCATLLLAAAGEKSGPLSSASAELFTSKIRPVIADVCLQCHSGDKPENGLRLDSRAALLRGGDSGPPVVPGKPDESLLVKAVRRSGDLQMPPDDKLSDETIKEFEDWVRGGAEWSGGDLVASKPAAEKRHWSFMPIKAVEPPADPTGWSQSPIDHFLHAALSAAGLAPVADADKRTLIRRVTFDLTGLPPTPEEIDEFLTDSSPDAWRTVIDRLLNSPQYGERWGRHWLDVARYADAAGFEQDGIFPEAWRYRDYVIRSFNADKPLNRFIEEQVAGDELWPDDKEAALGTGMYCIAPVQEDAALSAAMQLEHEWLADAADLTGAAFLGLTMGCARCHNHKYDPITQRDYYSLQAFFAGSDRPYSQNVIDKRIKSMHGILAEVPVPKEFENDPACTLKCDKKGPFVMFHRDKPMQLHVLHRGEIASPREKVAPAFPAALRRKSKSATPADARPENRRAALAKWITSPDNPLTARVLANRIWGWHFCQGLVHTPNDFGTQGDRPSHPELLDWLADDLTSHGWSLKHLVREIMLSRAYRVGSVASAEAGQKDPENRLLSHFPRQRLDADEIRDSLLACAGTLNPQSFGPPVHPALNKEELSGLFESKGRWKEDSEETQQNRRSVYVLARRSFALPLLATFDEPPSMTSCPRRNVTIVPTQALALLNSPLVQKQAAAFAKRVRAGAAKDTKDNDAAILRAWLLAFGRPPAKAEIDRVNRFLRERTAANKSAAEAEDAAWTALCRALFNANEFIFID
jgi:hypothetical protein